jgi:von Willebrand factor type A domain
VASSDSRPRAAASTLALLLFAAAASASESFTLTIPQRFDASQEIGEVRILLGLSAPAAGAQLVVGGSTTVPLGSTLAHAGDSVSFDSASGNRALIRYRPLSNFQGDFCAGGGAVEKTIALRFDGPQDVVNYRMSSFVAGAPAVECSNVSRRVAETTATIAANADGVAPALDATNNGRLPIDVVLVLDKSGSIAGLPPDSGPSSITTKVEILKAAANAFVVGWQEIDAPNAGVNADDRIAVVFFDSVATPQTLPGADAPANVFLRRSADWDSVTPVINTLTPGNATSIGAGINAAMQQWAADPASDVWVVVVTDGMQNTAPLVAPAPSGFLALPPVAILPAELRKRFIPIQMIGFGTPATVDENLIRDISLQTAGRSYMSVSASTMFDVFAMTLVSVLKGNTASLATRTTQRLSANEPAATRPVIVDKSAKRVVFALQWTPPFTKAFDLEVMRPGATVATTPTHTRTLPQAVFQTFDKPDVGTWTTRIRRNAQVRPEIPYTLNVFFQERHLDFRVTVDDRFRVRTEIAWDGKPLANLPAGAVRVRVLRPSATLASVLRASSSKEARPTPGDPQTKAQLAVLALTPREVFKLVPAPAETVTLREEKRGVYSAAIKKPLIPGSYAFEVVLDWTDPRTGRVHREERVEHFVPR